WKRAGSRSRPSISMGATGMRGPRGAAPSAHRPDACSRQARGRLQDLRVLLLCERGYLLLGGDHVVNQAQVAALEELHNHRVGQPGQHVLVDCVQAYTSAQAAILELNLDIR